MKLLFIISGSIAVKKCPTILKRLSDKKVHIDCIITNSAKKIINKKNNVFGSEYNQVAIIDQKEANELKRMTKIDVAKKLVNRIINSFEK